MPIIGALNVGFIIFRLLCFKSTAPQRLNVSLFFVHLNPVKLLEELAKCQIKNKLGS